jgi:hypothetical protein
LQAQHIGIRYLDENGNPLPEEHAGHDHGSHEEHAAHGHADHDHASHAGHDHDHGGQPRETHGEESHTLFYSFTGLAPRFGLAWQTGTFAEVGLSLDFYQIGYTEASEYVTFGYRNLRPYLSGEILISGRKTLGGGKAGLEFIMSTPVFGMAVGADGSYYTDGPGHAVTITPRLMLSFVYVELFYGYNIFVRNDLTRWVGRHRVGVSITLNPRFWHRKKQIYNDYYESYLE